MLILTDSSAFFLHYLNNMLGFRFDIKSDCEFIRKTFWGLQSKERTFDPQGSLTGLQF